MDRRSWPWKKKSSSSKHNPEAALASAAPSANASPSSKREQESHVKSQLQAVNQLYQQAEETIRSLNSKLAAAQKEITEKESLVKQHTKVAEDAVSGWEKAENETANIKQELEVTLEQKAELEEQVAYLDETLKDAAQNQKKAKEEHERRMQEMTTKKTKECERLRQDFESRLHDVGQRLLESTADNKVLTSTLQERLRMISELNDARSRAEAEIGVLNVRLENKDKDIMSLRYEVQVNNKELQVRNEEKDYCKREADAAHRQQQESLKKIQLLEAECQRLRALVRRKLPGPAAVAQMKQEADSWGREERRRSLGSRGDVRHSMDRKDIEIQLLTERVLSMEEETKMLREALTQRNGELQATRSMYSEPASTARKSRAGTATSECSFNDDGGSCADAWSSAISELDHFKKEKAGGSPGILVDDSKFQMMDDFVEMEQLASNSAAEHKSSTEVVPEASSERPAPKATPTPDELLAEKDKELQAANRLCVEISSKLIETEKEFAALKEKNAANELSLIKLQEKLDAMLERQSEGAENMDKLLEEKKVAPAADLSANVHKVIGLVEALAHAIGVVEHEDNTPLPSPSSSEASSSAQSHISTWQHGSGFEKLTTVSNKLVEGKVDFSDYIGELSSVLNVMTMSISSDNSPEQGRRPTTNSRRELTYAESDTAKEALTSLQKQNGVLQSDVLKLRQEMSRLKTEKEMLHQSYENSNLRILEIQSQLEKAEGLVADLKAKLASSQSEILTLRAAQDDRIKASESNVAKLREKLTLVEGQYEAERDELSKLAARYQELEKRLTEKQASFNDARVEPRAELGAHKNGLAECQRTILALGKRFPSPTAEATAHSRDNSFTSSLDNKPSSEEDDISLIQSSVGEQHCDSFGWSRPRIEGFDQCHQSLPWMVETSSQLQLPQQLQKQQQQQQQQQPQLEREDGSWLYSPDRTTLPGSRTVMRSPGRFLSARKEVHRTASSPGINDLTRSVNAGKNFGRFWGRNT